MTSFDARQHLINLPAPRVMVEHPGGGLTPVAEIFRNANGDVVIRSEKGNVFEQPPSAEGTK